MPAPTLTSRKSIFNKKKYATNLSSSFSSAPAAPSSGASDHGNGGLQQQQQTQDSAQSFSAAASDNTMTGMRMTSTALVKKVVKPAHQLKLREAELKEEVPRVLTANDPQVPTNIVKYNYKERAFKLEPPGQADLLAIHFSVDGSALHKESVEARQQQWYDEKKKEDLETARKAALDEAIKAGEESFFVDDGVQGSKGGFKYCDRAAQTFHQPMKEKGVGTEPPPVLNFSATCSQWEIYDAYLEQFHERQVSAPFTPIFLFAGVSIHLDF